MIIVIYRYTKGGSRHLRVYTMGAEDVTKEYIDHFRWNHTTKTIIVGGNEDLALIFGIDALILE